MKSAKRAQPGQARAFFDAHVDDETDDCILWPYSKSKGGYGQLGSKLGLWRVHVLACERHHGPRPEGMEVRHLCGVAACFNHRHLRWGTRKENIADRRTHGSHNIGSRNGQAVLTDNDVRSIRRAYADGDSSQRQLAEQHNVHLNTISKVIRRVTWGELV